MTRKANDPALKLDQRLDKLSPAEIEKAAPWASTSARLEIRHVMWRYLTDPSAAIHHDDAKRISGGLDKMARQLGQFADFLNREPGLLGADIARDLNKTKNNLTDRADLIRAYYEQERQGRPRNEAVYSAIRRLGVLYKQETQRQPSNPEFKTSAQALFTLIGESPSGMQGAIKAVSHLLQAVTHL